MKKNGKVRGKEISHENATSSIGEGREILIKKNPGKKNLEVKEEKKDGEGGKVGFYHGNRYLENTPFGRAKAKGKERDLQKKKRGRALQKEVFPQGAGRGSSEARSPVGFRK